MPSSSASAPPPAGDLVITTMAQSLANMAASADGNDKADAAGTPTGTSATASTAPSDVSGEDGGAGAPAGGSWIDLRHVSVDPDDARAAAESDRWYYYLSPRAARLLPGYKYDGADLSPLYKYVLSPLAAWLVENHTPMWLAPNAITLIGLGWMALSYLVVWYFCPGTYEANADLGDGVVGHWVPSAIFLFNGIAMLVYQTLDNMDGKQARRTGSSSALGLLFDHGCDAVNLIFGSANWIAAMAMVPGNVADLPGWEEGRENVQGRSLLSEYFGGDGVLAALLILCPMVAFYFSTWEQYYTGKLVLPPFNGPSEGLAMGAMLSIISFAWGPMYWQGTSLADGVIDRLEGFEGLEGAADMRGRVRNMDIIVFASVVGLLQEMVIRLISVLRAYGRRTLRTLVPDLLLLLSTLALVRARPHLLLLCPRSTMHLISGLFTEQTTQLMLDHMVDEEFTVRGRWTLFPYVALSAALWLGMPLSDGVLDAAISMYALGLWAYLAFKIGVHLMEICDVLGIWILDIETPHPKGASKAGTGGAAGEAAVAKKTN